MQISYTQWGLNTWCITCSENLWNPFNLLITSASKVTNLEKQKNVCWHICWYHSCMLLSWLPLYCSLSWMGLVTCCIIALSSQIIFKFLFWHPHIFLIRKQWQMGGKNIRLRVLRSTVLLISMPTWFCFV